MVHIIHTVNKRLQGIDEALGKLVYKSNKTLRDLQSLREDINDSQRDISDSVRSLHGQLNEHKEQTAANLTSLNLLLTDEPSSG